MKGELRRIKLELKAYLDKIKMSEGALFKMRQKTATLFDDMDDMITVADRWVVTHLRDDAPDDGAYKGEGVIRARNITQNLMNLHKLPILIGYQHDRGPIPHNVEDTLEAFANGRRNYKNLEEYRQRLHEFGQALTDLRLWIRRD